MCGVVGRGMSIGDDGCGMSEFEGVKKERYEAISAAC